MKCGGHDRRVSKFQRDKSPKVLRHRDLANGEKATERRTAAVERMQEEVTLGPDLAEAGHAARAKDLRDRTETDDRELALLFREGFPVGEHVFDLGCGPRVRGILRFDFLDRILRGDVAIEVEVAGLELDDAFARDRKMLGGDVVALPVVVTGGDHLLERLPVVDRETEDIGDENAELERSAEGIAIVELGRGVEHVGKDAGRDRPLNRFWGSVLLLQGREELEELTSSHEYLFHVDSLQYG